MDFGWLPPEVNSGRMYSGAGSGPLLAAAAAWDGLAAELNATASSYESAVSLLTSEWHGPSAAAMAAAVAPYTTWLGTSAAQAEQSASQARAAAAAYETAFAATVPPPVVAANRSLLMSLIATNFLGLNMAAIAATEFAYVEMWAQDATAMYGYAAASASATALAPFTNPPQTTNPAGSIVQVADGAAAPANSGLTQLVSMVPPALQSLAASAPAPAEATGPLFDLLNFLAGPWSPVAMLGIGGIPYLLALQCVMLPMNGSNLLAATAKAEAAGVFATEVAPSLDGLGARFAGAGPTVSAGMGNAGSVGRMSAPPGWTATATPALRPVAAALSTAGAEAAAMIAADGQSALMSNLALGGLAGRAIGTTGGAASHAVGVATGKAKKITPTTATIIVIPPSAED